MTIRNNLLKIFCILSLLSCNSGSRHNKVTGPDSLQEKQSFDYKDCDIPSHQSEGVWSMDYDSTSGDFVMRKPQKLPQDSLKPDILIRRLNSCWLSVQLQYVTTSHDTLFVKIPYSRCLSERMGTSGANQYLSSAVYTLAEVKGITHVNFDFEEGEHASPGTLERAEVHEKNR